MHHVIAEVSIKAYEPAPIELWVGFITFIVVMLALDLGLFQRKAHVLSMKEALSWVIVWVSMTLIAGAGLYLWQGGDYALEFLTAYLIEYSLSVDNLFIFLTIFSFFAVPQLYLHRVLFYGIAGAIVFRGAFIGAGIALINRFHWILYIFGAILVLTGIKLIFKGERVDMQKNHVFRAAKRFLPLTHEYHGQRFMVREGGKLLFTPLFVVLIVVEATDIVFALDSIPAVFGITRDPFIAFTSNIMAVLGLRAMFFLLAGAIQSLRYLNIGLAAVLVFIGVKLLIESYYKIPIAMSLGFCAAAIGISALASLRAGRAA